MGVDRDQIRRDAELLAAMQPGTIQGKLARHCLTLLTELEQAEKRADCDCVPCLISSKSCRKCGRVAVISQEQFMRTIGKTESRLAKVPALVEVLDDAREFADQAHDYGCAWPIGLDTDPQEQRGMARDTFIRNAEFIRDRAREALAAYEAE